MIIQTRFIALASCKPVMTGLLLLSICIAQTGWTQGKTKQVEPLRIPTTVVPVAPSVESFMRITSSSLASVSWDGQSVYFTSQASGQSQVYWINQSGWPEQLTSFAHGLSFFSLNYGASAAIVGADEGGTENTQLFLLDLPDGTLSHLTSDKSVRFENIVWAKDDSSFFFRSNLENGRDFFIYRYWLADRLIVKQVGDSVMNGSLSILALSPDGTRLMIERARSNFESELYLYDLQKRQSRRLLAGLPPARYSSVTMMPDNRRVFLLTDNSPDGFLQPARYDMIEDRLEPFPDRWPDTLHDVEGLVVSRNHRYMAAFVNQHGRTVLALRDLESKQPLPVPEFTGLVSGLTFDQQGNLYLTMYNSVQPANVWKWEPQGRKLTPLTYSSYPGIDQSALVEPQLVQIRSFDSLLIDCFLYLPRDYQRGSGIPFIVYAHGGPESQFKPTFIRSFQHMISQGFGILAVNPRGSSGYGRSFLMLDNGPQRKLSLADYKAATDWLIDNQYSKPGMVGIRGRSYGGYVVLGMITEYPDLFSAAISEVGIANFQTFLANTASYRRSNREAEYGSLSDTALLRSISPITKADRIITPLMLFHGENDPRVPITEARQMAAAIAARGGVVDSLFFSGEGHGNAQVSNQVKENETAVSFFRRYLMQGEPKPTSSENPR